MEQYIKKSSVVAEIRRIMTEEMSLFKDCCKDELENIGSIVVYTRMKMLLSFLDTLEVKDEVDSSHPIKAMKDALRMEYEKGRADVLRCIDPDEMVADFCSQPFSKTRSIASVYRQGITDILKRINNNEENSITGTRSIDDCGL